MKLAVGDVVVYGAHGAGLIAARETRSLHGKREVVIVLALSRGLSVQLPLAHAEELLRPAADEAEIGRVREVLAATAARSADPWLKRQREARIKLRSTIGLAEILRDGAERDGERGKLSPTERELVKRARELLVNEIALARGVELAEAGEWIDEQLAS
jgi:CarD family transcriptional regulator